MRDGALREQADLLYATFNAGDLENLGRLLSPTARLTVSSFPAANGRDKIIIMLRKIFNSFDVSFSQWEHLVDGDRVAIRAMARAEYKKTFFGWAPARGQKVEIPFSAFGEADDEGFTSLRVVFSPVDWRNSVS